MFRHNKVVKEKDIYKELFELRTENEMLKAENERLKSNKDHFDTLIKECEEIKGQWEESIKEANEAKMNFINLYKAMTIAEIK